MIQVSIRPALKADTEKIKELGNKIFGHGYLDDWFLADEKQKKLDDFICLVATKDGNIIGMIHLFVIDYHPLDKFKTSDFDITSLEETVGSDKVNEKLKSVFLSLIMVDDKYTRRGAGTSLYAKVFEILSEINVRNMYAACWKESPNLGIIPFLEKQGWKSVTSKEEYWYEDSLKKGYQCARCGNPCFCTAVLMSLDLPEGVPKPKLEPG